MEHHDDYRIVRRPTAGTVLAETDEDRPATSHVPLKELGDEDLRCVSAGKEGTGLSNSY